MKISVFGLGYVGCVSAACLAKEGHEVIGVDINQVKIDLISQGKSPIVEQEIDQIIFDAVKTDKYSPGKLTLSTDSAMAVANTDVSIICVGTPSNENGSLKLEYVRRCASNIGLGIKQKDSYHVVIARSTMLPRSVEDVVIKELELVSGKKVGKDFGVVMNPEFLREGTSVKDFYNPAITVIGQYDDKSGAIVEEMYRFLNAPVVKTDIRSAEMIKYANNSFHAMKVVFGNEIGNICKAMEIDSHIVMDIVCMDDKLNLSPYYLKPGFAFGGSCLPKDVRALTYKARTEDVDVPMLNSLLESNRLHIDNVANRIIRYGKKKIGILGLSFKAGTDDMRESPMVILVETLIGKGFDIKIYDKNVSIAKLFGANKEYIEKGIPHISSLITTEISDIVDHSDLIVVGNKGEEFEKILENTPDDKVVIDLVRIKSDTKGLPEGYNGICW